MDPLENLERRVRFQVGFFKSGIVANLVIYGLIGLVLLGLGGLVWWKMRKSGALDKLEQAHDAVNGKVVPKGASWDGKTPFSCGGDEAPVLENVTATAGVTANGSCHLTLRNATITADVAITANGSSEVTVEGGALSGSDVAISALGNAKVTVHGATVNGKTKHLGNATITGP
jgi:hypothetical protein